MPQVQETARRGGEGHPPGRGGGGGGGGGGSEAFPVPTARLGLWLFLAVATLLFSALMSAYIIRMGYPDWQPLPEPGLLWVNTGFLLFASGALQRAVRAARRGDGRGVRQGLALGGGLGGLFLLGQLVAWRQLAALGYFVAHGPASSFFYLITALHGLHLLGGIGAWARVMARASREETARVRLAVELIASYWHFLLVVWLVLFGLMLVT